MLLTPGARFDEATDSVAMPVQLVVEPVPVQLAAREALPSEVPEIEPPEKKWTVPPGATALPRPFAVTVAVSVRLGVVE